MKKIKFSATVAAVSFHYPLGDVLISNVSCSFNDEKYGLVGENGAGKSTLAKLLVGDLEPCQGNIKTNQRVTYLEQFAERPHQLVSEFLLTLWENAGSEAALWAPLIEGIPLDQEIKTLSGGEWTRLRIALALATPQGFLILDEPTNNLDQEAKNYIMNFIRAYEGGLLVISHDRDLLNVVDKTVEMSNHGLSIYGGNYDFYILEKENERLNLKTKIERAKTEKRRSELSIHEKKRRQEKRSRAGNKFGASGSIPRIIAGGLKRKAQVTQGKMALEARQDIEGASENLCQLNSQIKNETQIYFDVPRVYLPEGKLLFSCEDFNISCGKNFYLWEEDLNISLRGPRRWALAGKNGSGKTTFLKALVGELEHGFLRGHLRRGDLGFSFLRQDYHNLNIGKSILENIVEVTDIGIVEARNQLARFGFIGDRVHQKVETLSGGEQLLAALAKALLRKPVPQWLILDEPTNNLSLRSLEVLERVLRQYNGALVVVSHDEEFLKHINIEEVYVLQTLKS